jgi:site-specific recombinase XerD
MTAAAARNTRPPVPSWAAPWIDSFRLYLRAANASHHTVSRYTDAAGWLAGWLAPQHPKLGDWDAVTHQHVQAFLAYLADEGYSRKYMHNIGAALQRFWRWWAEEEAQPDPMAKVRVPAAPKLGEVQPPVLEIAQLAALLKDAEAERDFESRRDAAIIRLFASTGMRLSELTLLNLDQVRKDDREATVVGKGGRVRTVKYDHRCALALDRYLRMRSKHQHAYLPGLWLSVRRKMSMTPSGVRQMIERRGMKLGLHIHPHLFRHTFAHNWLDNGGAEGDLQELAGWESSQMLRHYGRSARSARAKRAYDRVDVMGGV